MELSTSIQELRRVLVEDPASPHWSWRLRAQLAQVREALANDRVRSFDGWLNARASSTDRTRRQLMARVTAAVTQDLQSPDRARWIVGRLLQDLEHFRQRLADLAYDSVELEIGGSE